VTKEEEEEKGVLVSAPLCAKLSAIVLGRVFE